MNTEKKNQNFNKILAILLQLIKLKFKPINKRGLMYDVYYFKTNV